MTETDTRTRILDLKDQHQTALWDAEEAATLHRRAVKMLDGVLDHMHRGGANAEGIVQIILDAGGCTSPAFFAVIEGQLAKCKPQDAVVTDVDLLRVLQEISINIRVLVARS